MNNNIHNMFVIKRNGQQEEVSFDKVTRRIKYLCKGVLRDGTIIGNELKGVQYIEVAKKVISKITDGISTRELDEYAAEYCGSMVQENYEYGILGGRIAVSNHHKNTLSSFVDTVKLLYENKDEYGEPQPLIRRDFYKNVLLHRNDIESMIDYQRDFIFDYFGFSTLQYAYLLKSKSRSVVERPQHLLMRVAITVRGSDLDGIKETYDLLSKGYYTHATPTLYNAGTLNEQMSSCFLLGMADSIEAEGGIADIWGACARISKWAGGIAINCGDTRAAGSLIRGTNGTCKGILDNIRVFNNIARYVDQGGKRPGAFALYIEPWHADIYDFLDAKKLTGIEDKRARDLFYGLMINDVFMERVVESQHRITAGIDQPVMWSLMCPDECRDLTTSYGSDFTEKYQKYERAGKYRRQVDVQDLWKYILNTIKETGGPYILHKGHINRKSNQANIGVIRNSNLCCEIVEYCDSDEFAVCNLASICLSRFAINDGNGSIDGGNGNGNDDDGNCNGNRFNGKRPGTYFDLTLLESIAYTVTKNLNTVININKYPVEQARKSNFRHRPVGLGVQGLADAFMILGYPYESKEAGVLNKYIFEAIYHGALRASNDMAIEREERVHHLSEFYRDGLFVYKDKYGLDAVPVESGDADTDAFIFCELAELRPIKEEVERASHYGSYSSFIGSPLSKGKFQFDLWEAQPSNNWDWEELRESIIKHGVRNSLVTTLMPTASTAQIWGNTECMEPIKYNLYTRRVDSGEFQLLNRYLQRDLANRGIWTSSVRKDLIKYRGSIQEIEFPDYPGKTEDDVNYLKELYKTAFQMKKRRLIEMSAERGAYIDQTQSFNMFVSEPTYTMLHNIIVKGWECGLKTGLYYLRREPVVNAVQFTVNGNGNGNGSGNDSSNGSGNGNGGNGNGNGNGGNSSLPQLEGDTCESCSA